MCGGSDAETKQLQAGLLLDRLGPNASLFIDGPPPPRWNIAPPIQIVVVPGALALCVVCLCGATALAASHSYQMKWSYVFSSATNT